MVYVKWSSIEFSWSNAWTFIFKCWLLMQNLIPQERNPLHISSSLFPVWLMPPAPPPSSPSPLSPKCKQIIVLVVLDYKSKFPSCPSPPQKKKIQTDISSPRLQGWACDQSSWLVLWLSTLVFFYIMKLAFLYFANTSASGLYGIKQKRTTSMHVGLFLWDRSLFMECDMLVKCT